VSSEGETADPSAPLRYGRDDKGEVGSFDLQFAIWMEGGLVYIRRTQRGSANGKWLSAFASFVAFESETADPSVPLRSGRDDKGEVGSFDLQFAIWMEGDWVYICRT
jgi:hypothetical protein